jgi:hypothetical protein
MCMKPAERHNRVGFVTATPTPHMLIHDDACVGTLERGVILKDLHALYSYRR